MAVAMRLGIIAPVTVSRRTVSVTVSTVSSAVVEIKVIAKLPKH